MAGFISLVAILIFLFALLTFIFPLRKTWFNTRVKGFIPLIASCVLSAIAGSMMPKTTTLTNSGETQSAPDKTTPVIAVNPQTETPIVGPSKIDEININTRTIILSGKGQVAAQQMGEAISIVADRVRTGEIKPTSEVQWAQFKFLFRHDDGNETSIGSLRVPFEKLKSAPVSTSIDHRPFLDLVDHTERGGDFDTVEAFCRGSMEPDKGQKFCELVASGK